MALFKKDDKYFTKKARDLAPNAGAKQFADPSGLKAKADTENRSAAERAELRNKPFPPAKPSGFSESEIKREELRRKMRGSI